MSYYTPPMDSYHARAMTDAILIAVKIGKNMVYDMGWFGMVRV